MLDYINEVLNETVDDDDKQNLPDDWEEGLTFTARSSRKYSFKFVFRNSVYVKLWLRVQFFPFLLLYIFTYWSKFLWISHLVGLKPQAARASQGFVFPQNHKIPEKLLIMYFKYNTNIVYCPFCLCKNS